MFAAFPAPLRGRPRLSKALPTAPEPSAENETLSAMMMSTNTESPLPPRPKDAVLPSKNIPRRPVGGQAQPTRQASIQSFSSVYSDSPGLSRTISNSSSRDTKGSPSTGDSEVDSLPPPAPPKDDKEQYYGQKANILDGPTNLTNSPPRTELWKRRSVRSDRSIHFPDLKLRNSNGSTASPPRRQELPEDDPRLPRSLNGRKPVPARPAPRQPDITGMGNNVAKLEGKLESKLRKKESSEDSLVPQDGSSQQEHSTVQRLPTPVYQKADKQIPSTPQVLSPLSPFTPPEDTAPALPSKPEARSTQNVHQTQDAQTQDAEPTVSEIPNLLSTHSRDSSETLTITSTPQVMRSPQPQKAFAAQILPPQSPLDKAGPGPAPPDSRACYFPTISSAMAPGTAVPGLPLEITHYDCYQSHKFMRPSKNAVCPVACMVCQKKDAEMRWRCTWCCLSACGSCMKVMSAIPGKDLRVCLERVGGER